MSELYRAKVTKVASNGVIVEIPKIAPGAAFGPYQSGPLNLQINDDVLVGSVSGYTEDMVVVAPLLSHPQSNVPIYFFETLADRNAVFASPVLSPTFTWIDDLQKLEVWTDEDNSWHRANWDETRVAGIETNVTTLQSSLTALTTRVTNLEGLTVTDSSSVDFTLSGAWPKDITAVVKEILTVTDTATVDLTLTPGTGWPKALSAAVIADSIPLNNLSDVVVSSPASNQRLKYNGTNWVNAAEPTAGNGLQYSSDTYSVLADTATDNKVTVSGSGVYVQENFRFATSATTNSSSGTTETMMLSAATSFVWKAGRCYIVWIRGRMNTDTTGNLAIFYLKRGTTTGSTNVVDFGGFKMGSPGEVIPVYISALVRNNTGSDVTQSVQLSLKTLNGNVTWDGGTIPRSFIIEDCGRAASYGTAANDI